jgi:PIN domain nuclease of toxin-antitoxin system
LRHPPDTFLRIQIQRNELSLLSIELEHTIQVAKLPFYHNDPFDRLLISQAIVENIPLMSADKTLSKYNIERIW